jgi:hypothetical protein
VGIRALATPVALLAALVAATVAAALPGTAGGSAAPAPGGAFAAWAGPSISGQSFEDRNGDGQRDAAEPAVEGFTIYADANGDGDGADPGEGQTVTASDGTYMIGGLVAGTPYALRQASRAGWSCSAPAPCERAVTLAPGEAAEGMDFGSWRGARLLGRVFDDVAHDGVAHGNEPARARRTVYLDMDGDGLLDDGEPTSLSGVDGSYAFSGLHPGTWIVRQVVPEHWLCSLPSPCFHEVTVASDGEYPGHDFGGWLEPVLGSPDGPAPTQLEIGTIGLEPSVEAGDDLYVVDRAGPCRPLRVDIPVESTTGLVLSVKLVLHPSDGGDDEEIQLADVPSDPADGVWSGTVPCARDAELEVVATATDGETRGAAGTIMLIDPSGTVYDHQLYSALTRKGVAPAAARCGSALAGATVTLERSVDGRFQTVETGDDVRPSANPQETAADGSYRWDVPEGSYRVRVTKPGYRPATSRTVSVPPAVANLHVALERRSGTRAPAAHDCGEPPAKPAARPEKDRCIARPLNAGVRGRSIRRVVFYLDGRRLRTVTRADRRGRFGITVERRKLVAGRHVLRAKVFFTKASRRRPALLTLPIKRCVTSSTPSALHASPKPGCGARPFLAWVRGNEIRTVAFRLDGRRVGTVGVADWRGRYGTRIDPAGLAGGRHVLVARIQSVKHSGTRSRTVRLRFTKCR